MSAEPGVREREARAAIVGAYRMPEGDAVGRLLGELAIDADERAAIGTEALRLARAVRRETAGSLRAEAFLQRYSLSTHEGIVLMCLAEALLRIPDAATQDALIRDKLAGTHWSAEDEGGLLVNAASWGLMLTGKLAEWQSEAGGSQGALRRLVARAGEPLVRAALRHAMEIMAGQFVAGETIEAALERSPRSGDWRASYDMLGEAARTAADAQRYFEAYRHAIATAGASGSQSDPIAQRPGISIKLSALHPRYEVPKRERVMAELLPRMLHLCEAAAAVHVGITIDAEEADRLLLSLELFDQLARAPSLARWSGLGLAVQAYQKRALAVCRWLALIAAERPIMVRLVKGAYWDTEIKLAQVHGMPDYPVFTRKAATDLSFMACARVLMNARGVYAQLATHNCHTVAYALALAGDRRDFEFQKLHGMGDALYDLVVRERGVPCRVYAPVGRHDDLLAYLVRRLLENGANTSFVHQVADESVPLERLAADPIALLSATYTPSKRTPLPRRLYPDRLNSEGIDFSDEAAVARLARRVEHDRAVAAGAKDATAFEPGDRRRPVGSVRESTPAQVEAAAAAAHSHWRAWDATPPQRRADILERAADLLEARRDELISMIVREAGRTFQDASAEVREAADYCRYYALQARKDFASPIALAGPVGESNRLELAGRGVFACISPWNFPLAIFAGQVVAALAAGNTVVAKPAEQTPLVGALAVTILHEAGVPREALHLVVGTGEAVGAPLLRHPAIAGVAFTGSYETAKRIERALAAREGPIVPFIAETGGFNAMVVDSSALPEQVVADVIASAFNSAGQRCSALRVLLVQEESAQKVIDMLAGAIAELRVGDPARADTDVGPVIDEEAQHALEQHAAAMERAGKVIARAELAPEAAHGFFVPPLAFDVALDWLPKREVFGPILHVVRYRTGALEPTLDAIAAAGYGLTLGIHSRLDSFVERVRRHLRVGNTYVNRNMIGAVVGVQPFGGEGLSGTGPKAGSPYTLHRFAVERAVTVNTAAMGGTPELFAPDD